MAEHYTISGLVQRWGLSHTFIRREIWAGRLRAMQFGKAWRISAAEVAGYEARMERQANENNAARQGGENG